MLKKKRIAAALLAAIGWVPCVSHAISPSRHAREAVKQMLKSDPIGCDPGQKYTVRGGRVGKAIDRVVRHGKCEEIPKKQRSSHNDNRGNRATERTERMDRNNDRAERADQAFRTA